MLDVEIWADSFREGEWLLQTLADSVPPTTIDVYYEYGFRPVYEFGQLGDITSLRATVYGDYRAWPNLPEQIDQLLGYGRPDIVAYSRADDLILFGVEETAAVPTGNQSLQRLERVWYAATKQIPFVYLMGEYGLHKDGGVRRTSIWPAYLSIKLSGQFTCPSLILTYGDKEHYDDYNVGYGLQQTGQFVYLALAKKAKLNVKTEEKNLYKAVFQDMAGFILNQMDEIAPFCPGKQMLGREDFAEFLASRIVS